MSLGVLKVMYYTIIKKTIKVINCFIDLTSNASFSYSMNKESKLKITFIIIWRVMMFNNRVVIFKRVLMALCITPVLASSISTFIKQKAGIVRMLQYDINVPQFLKLSFRITFGSSRYIHQKFPAPIDNNPAGMINKRKMMISNTFLLSIVGSSTLFLKQWIQKRAVRICKLYKNALEFYIVMQ